MFGRGFESHQLHFNLNLFVSHQVSGDSTTTLGIAFGTHARCRVQCDKTHQKKEKYSFHWCVVMYKYKTLK